MANHPPASRLNVMKGGLPAIRNGAKGASTSIEAEKEAYEESKAEVEAKIEEAKAADKIGEILDYATYVDFQTPTQIWGAKAAAEIQFTFGRWYFMAKNNAIVDTFMTQEKYDAADVEARRALCHRYGTRYAALGPNHSRRPIQDKDKAKEKALRAQLPSMQEQLSSKVA